MCDWFGCGASWKEDLLQAGWPSYPTTTVECVACVCRKCYSDKYYTEEKGGRRSRDHRRQSVWFTLLFGSVLEVLDLFQIFFESASAFSVKTTRLDFTALKSPTRGSNRGNFSVFGFFDSIGRRWITLSTHSDVPPPIWQQQSYVNGKLLIGKNCRITAYMRSIIKLNFIGNKISPSKRET